ncbi:hypothetical protein [Streptomyces sp. NPDC049881]|uniref:hypothetical protein n=1 Tax=Streptomyces sp. NPDC049881 TaxID=3155778 RepID=UPI00343AE861
MFALAWAPFSSAQAAGDLIDHGVFERLLVDPPTGFRSINSSNADERRPGLPGGA